MASTLYQRQLKSLCSTPETLYRAQSILNLALLRTGQGTGFIGNAAALPAVAAYLASEELNANEVSLSSAMLSACVQRSKFEDMLKTVRAALQLDGSHQQAHTEITYQSLVASRALRPSEDAVAWMEEAEAALPRVDMMKERYGTNSVTCAVFCWVCDLMECPTLDKAFCTDCNVGLAKVKNIMRVLEGQCSDVADRVRSTVAQIRASQPVLSRAPSHNLSSSGSGTASFLGTPTKRRRVESPVKSKDRLTQDVSPEKRVLTPKVTAPTNNDAAVAAFHAAIAGQTKLPNSRPTTQSRRVVPQASTSSIQTSLTNVDPSTPRRPRIPRSSTSNAMDVDSPAQTSAAATPTRHAAAIPSRVRRRYYPVFHDQEQWITKGLRLDKIWSEAEVHCNRMSELYGHPFEQYRPSIE